VLLNFVKEIMGMFKSKLVISILLLLSIVVTLVPGCVAKPSQSANGYTAVIPSVLQVGLPQAISVALFHDSQPVSGNVQVTLSRDGKDVFTTTNRVSGNDKIQFTLPSLPEGDYQVSLKGNDFNDKTTVKVENQFLLFIETDKPIYKPGQDIMMRIFSVNSDLLPVSQDATVEILDAKGTKVFRATVKTDDYGMADLKMPLSSEPNLGVWKINVSSGNQKTGTDVRVEEYVLPKYEVNLELPRDWYLVNEAVKGKITADYTFGKPVQGELEIKAWRYTGKWEQYNTFTAKIDGSADFTIPAVNYVAGVPTAGGNGNVRLDVTVTENSTGYVQETSKLLTVSQSSMNIQIIPSGVYFKPGLPFSYLIVTQTPDNQLVDSSVQATVTYYDSKLSAIGKADQKTVAAAKGKALVNITPPDNAVAFTINCTAQGVSTNMTIQAGYSPSGNFIHLEQTSSGTPKIGEAVRFHIYSTQEARTFYYEVISRGKVVFSDYTNSPDIAFQVTPQMGPSAKLLVYQVLGNSEVAADYLPFDVTANYPQSVNVTFSNTSPEPGSDITVSIKGQGQAEVSLAAVDKSVFILAENRMNLQQVFDKLEALYMQPQAEIHPVSIYSGITTQGAADIFKNAGVVVLSNNSIPQGKNYASAVQAERGDFFNGLGLGGKAAVPAATSTATTTMTTSTSSGASQNLAEVERVRQYFPETWLWQAVTTDADGQAAVKATVPDSITTWMLRAVSISKTQGLGVAEAQLTVFQPFFVTADLPYSAIRGEEFPVSVAIYNYLDKAQSVQVDIKTQDWFTLLDQSSKTVTIPPNDIGSVKFLIKPTKLGNNDLQLTARSSEKADSIIKPLLVEAEGVAKESVTNLVLSGGNNKTFDTSIPAMAVDGSGRVYFTATAGYLTQTMDGLEKLIQMPYGCGEQNMIVFAPDVFITKYLKASGTLKPEIMATAEKLMITGYQRELTYRRPDGSFSAFGTQDKEGSLWLTAFVLKTFAQAQDLIYVDSGMLSATQAWIVSHQNSDGSFDPVGLLIHKDLSGGLSNKASLTAYVAVALMQAGEKTASGKAVKWLEGQVSGITDSYTMALTSYALELAGSAKAADACQKLMGMAKEDSNGLYWADQALAAETTPGLKAAPSLMPIANRSASIETTAYAMMALVLQKNALDAGKAAKWLISQRNAYGGYGSTQDTVVALEALVLYSTGARSDIDLTVTLSSGEAVIKKFKIDSSNYDVLQTVELPLNKSVTVWVQGKGEALGQVVSRYNLPAVDLPAAGEILSLKVDYDTANVQVNDIVKVSVNIAFNPPTQIEAGMTVVDISVPTGFVPVTGSIDKVLKSNPLIKRYDIAGRKVIFYLDNLKPGDKVAFSFDVQAQYPVKAKGTVSQVYAYYQPEISGQVLGQDMTVE
jgi:CD109 antigen